MNQPPLFDPISYLMNRKFPGGISVRHARKLASFGAGTTADKTLERAEQKAAYETELRGKSPEELALIVEGEREKETIENIAAATAIKEEIERAEQQMFYNKPYAQADFDHWSKAAYWTLEEAIALSFGKNPNVVNWEKIKDSAYSFTKKFWMVRDLALRERAVNALPDPVAPGVFLAWAARTKIDVPGDLIAQVKARGIVIADWKANYDSLKKQFDILLTDRDKLADISKQLIQERNDWKAKAEALQLSAGGPPSTSRDHRSNKLAILNQTAERFWANSDRDNRGAHPVNPDVVTWLMKHGYTETLAEKAATIIRPEWARTGRKPEE